MKASENPVSLHNYICVCVYKLVSRGQTAIFFVGAGKNRVWHISDTKLVLSHLEVLTLNLFLSHTRYFIGNKAPVICFYEYGNEVFLFCRKSSLRGH